MSDEDTLLEFPCDFPIKVMGVDDGELKRLVMGIVARHAIDLEEAAFRKALAKQQQSR